MDKVVRFRSEPWIESWDLQQNAHIMNREERFQFMFDIVEHAEGRKFTALDLACGPGSLSGRLLKRFPESVSVAVDYDPVLLTLASNYSGYDHSRLTFIEGDLSGENWIHDLPSGEYDAVLSTTALHWLQPESLEKLYRSVYGLLREGGVFLNGDHIYPHAESDRIREILTEMRHQHEDAVFSSGSAKTWDDWWKDLRQCAELDDLFRERDRRYPNSENHSQDVSLEAHESYLRSAGFKDFGVVWQSMDNRILMAIK